jgi:LacI family transcriptional regulator, galactose operon repressor
MSNKIEQATMRDVARVAGVSLATVSYVVNGGPRPVSARSRRRVLAAIEELGYAARRRRSADLTLGLIVPHATNAFFARVVAGVEAALGPDEYVLACSSGEDPVRERELVRLMLGHKVDGLLVTPCTEVPPEVARLPALGVPVVVMDRDAATTSLNAVTMNNYGSAVKATRLLAASGHRRIALLNGPERVDTARERRRGYLAALAAAGLPTVRQYLRDVEFGREHGATATRELLGLDTPPDAIFSTSLILTAGMLGAIRERGLHWPDDIAIVGFGDAIWAPMMTPPLTVVEQPAERLGSTAAQLLVSLVRDGGPGTGQRIVLESEIVLRDSHWGRAGRTPDALA